MFKIFLSFLLLCSCAFQPHDNKKSADIFPTHWWNEIEDKKWWEISPASVKKNSGKVVLSKRNELGILSNFSKTPFTLDGKRYESIEGFWQALKYPDSLLENDTRLKIYKSKYTRRDVESMIGFEAKKAGDEASSFMKSASINWVSYQGQKMIYRTPNKGEHYHLIYRAMRAKMRQNPKVKEILLKTKNLLLLPDHLTSVDDPPAWKYYQIWMDIRSSLNSSL